MKRKIVRITESDLHKIIKSSVFNILSENVEDDNYMIGGEDDGNLGYFHIDENIENEYQAFHGSSADFDKFNHKKYLSSGASSQSFGWGTYVSDDKVIADSYADSAFENTRQLVINGMLEDNKYSLSQYIIMNNKKFLKEYFPNLYDDYVNSGMGFRNYVVSTMYDELFNQHHDEEELLFYVNRIKENLKRGENPDEDDFILLCLYGFYHLNKVEIIGNKIVYEVDIPEDNGGNYIEWYENFPPQFMKRVLIGLHNLKPQYLDKIAEHNYPFRSGLYGYLKHPNFNRILDILATEDGYHNFFASGMYTKTQDTQGSDVYRKLEELFDSDKAASLFLMNMCGFDGIKYPTGTRWNRPIGAKEDGYNYVLFNANNVKIINKERLGK